MHYDLCRVDYTICGVTYPDTLKILPNPNPNSQQKFAVGDKNGVLQCLSIKDEEPIVHFKTLPGKPITSLQLAYSIGSQTDKIFAASGNEVKGYTRKGKLFLTIETSLSETITSMCVLGADLVLCSGRNVISYRDLKEYHSYVCEDRVLDIAAFTAPNNTRVRLLILIANKGAAILESGQVVTRTSISSGPSRLAVPPSLYSADIYSYYGAVDGSIGLLVYENNLLTSKCLMEEQGLGSVVCLGWFNNTGGTHLAVGRHDGSIQLYLINMEDFSEKPRLKFTYNSCCSLPDTYYSSYPLPDTPELLKFPDTYYGSNPLPDTPELLKFFCGEPITSVAGGCVGIPENELMAVTFSGRIFTLRPRRTISGPGSLVNIPQDALVTRRTKLELEIARLEKQTANEREKYQKSTRSVTAGISAPPLLDTQCELSGATCEGWQEAKLTSAVPLDMLFIYCSKRIEMQTDNAAVLSICPSQASDLLATIRCQAGTRRLWLRMRLIANALGNKRAESARVLIYVLPAGAPRVARLIKLRLPALSYYCRHEDPDVDTKKRSWCLLQISGGFSVAEMTSWLSEVLPCELPRPSNTLAFGRSHVLLGTVLTCRYQRGTATFKSDNVSTLAVIRDVISYCSIEKNIRLDISCDIPDDCCAQAFLNLKDQFELEYMKNRNTLLKNALSALELDSKLMKEQLPHLCEDYLKVWMSSDDEMKNNHFEELVDAVKHWYDDWQTLSLHGRKNFVNESQQLSEALQECRLEEIVKILQNKPKCP